MNFSMPIELEAFLLTETIDFIPGCEKLLKKGDEKFSVS
jgi:hypothetical protein